MRIGKFARGISLVAALGLSMVLGACGSSGSGSNAASTSSTTSSTEPRTTVSTPASSSAPSTSAISGGEIKVTLKDRSFLPDEIRVKAGAKVVFVIENNGTEEHTFEMPDFKLLKKIPAGKSTRMEWTVPDKKGTWDVGCFLTAPAGVHDGMEGTLIIE